jgi:hypothetical protein
MKARSGTVSETEKVASYFRTVIDTKEIGQTTGKVAEES